MNAAEFIDAVKLVVRDAAINGTISNLDRPPGRKPASDLVRTASFYQSLTDEQRTQVKRIVAHAVDQAVFGLLSVIDGVRVIEDAGRKGHLELMYCKDSCVLLNPRTGPGLHELYNS